VEECPDTGKETLIDPKNMEETVGGKEGEDERKNLARY